ncbi:Aspartyl-tRNA(Asn) amidotransferase subunit B, Glutamyl-tRNA(Gln) amidotransferase subunit B [Mesoplasma florum W37]|uniref:Aspartyl/glutamyl-tRNA(Asn/Gln) amidotransferase subunit B n=1 Tax=Mesoplasma florum TaxID=2151 RepID=A0AAD0MN37_MESFO|nr:Asp-tRNA(Asn)/Glu-tRNA(Gln) amidotransferase subunit GatB [Mesoplasma florum]AGY41235.1 Aspartyl-tRNA(Asn) amidotransferase subunit B, Glutamyl-tRNA(Gln) amidotransferase subunit B [Mesoplasma florum W37]AVN59464.1 Asp-tRNA(Asn)/Glu-tRNA(Gln) amidotransferase GatCAB subunit B [Mesoplasma florum]AVN65573.1 Aspartyl-tRNA(Asn) amidotransferase subunit B / Glutamyl-tRNA(Gln) amidotransferase subunit B [Mesoplasma florum]
MKNFEIVIGIENHVELKTKSKMFSSAPVSYGETPNTNVNETDMAYPGSLPTINKKGIELAIRTCNALNMEIDTLVKFDRKNYFYPDLTKGYQITQQYNPIGKNGKLNISVNGLTKEVDIERLHMEEDTAKQIHKDDLTYIDYNRAGTGLVEIVTRPVLRSADEACAYVEKLREVLLFLKVSDVKMNEGSLRTDVNISIRPFGTEEFSNKVEVKNLNSISNIKKAIEFEVERQTKLMLNNEIIIQETRRFDDTTNSTVSMRSKSDALDYKYFREPNIMPIQLKKEWVEDCIKNSPELADIKRIKYVNDYKISINDANIILTSIEMTEFFEETIKFTNNYTKVANILISDIQAQLNNENTTIDKLALLPSHLAEMINLVDQSVISSKHTKTILPIIMKDSSKSVIEIVEELNIKMISDENEIANLVNPIIESNLELLEQYSERPERVTKTIMGQLMKVTGGNVNPETGMNIIIKLVENKIK